MNQMIRKATASLALEARKVSAFLFRDFHLVWGYFSWVMVFLVYAIVSGASVVLIGVASGDKLLALNLLLGVVLWSYLSCMFSEISQSIQYERWEGTIEYTFMAPVSRVTHLFGLSIFGTSYALLRAVVIASALLVFVDIDLHGANIWGVVCVFALATLSFIGLGILAAILPLISPEQGAQATNIFQATLLLVSGVYFPISVLPSWAQPLSVISPATYALSASRKLLGIGVEGSVPGALLGSSLWDVAFELKVLVIFGLISLPLGVYIFSLAERSAKRSGKLKRSG